MAYVKHLPISHKKLDRFGVGPDKVLNLAHNVEWVADDPAPPGSSWLFGYVGLLHRIYVFYDGILVSCEKRRCGFFWLPIIGLRLNFTSDVIC